VAAVYISSVKALIFLNCLTFGWQFDFLSDRFPTEPLKIYEGWSFNSGNYLFTTDTK